MRSDRPVRSGDGHAKRRSRLPFLVRVHALTPAESKVTTLVFAGLRMQTPAERLCISVNTLQDHFKVIFDKVEASEPYELAAAGSSGIVVPIAAPVPCRPGSRVKPSK